jgi:hypothetical protein
MRKRKRFSVAQLKRDAKEGNLEALMTFRNGKPADKLPKHCQGWRKIVGANTRDIFFQIPGTDKVSFLTVKPAALVEYTGNTLKTFTPGYREPAPEEWKLLKEWNRITETAEYQERLERDCLTDMNSCYYQELWFFRDHNAEYLTGWHSVNGVMLDSCRRANGDPDFIRDNKVKGELCMCYKIRPVEEK